MTGEISQEVEAQMRSGSDITASARVSGMRGRGSHLGHIHRQRREADRGVADWFKSKKTGL